MTLTALDIKPGDRVRPAGSTAPWETVVTHVFTYASKSRGTVTMTFIRRDGDTPFMIRTWNTFAQEAKFEVER